MSDEQRQKRLDALSERIAHWHVVGLAVLAIGAIVFWLIMYP
jgi:hypothetical protein